MDSKVDAVLFDCDGLLVDSETLGMQVAAQVCKEFGIELPERELRAFIGVTDEKWFMDVLHKRGLDIPLKTLLNRQFEIYEAQLPEVQAFPGARELPHELKEGRTPVGLVSGSTRKQINIVLHALGLSTVFDPVVTWEDVGGRSKPDPYGYQLALERLNASRPAHLRIRPERVVVLEDAVSGIRAGLAAGMRVIGVRNLGMQDLSQANRAVDSLDVLRIQPLGLWIP